jgi:hypothetical protein
MRRSEKRIGPVEHLHAPSALLTAVLVLDV